MMDKHLRRTTPDKFDNNKNGWYSQFDEEEDDDDKIKWVTNWSFRSPKLEWAS